MLPPIPLHADYHDHEGDEDDHIAPVPQDGDWPTASAGVSLPPTRTDPLPFPLASTCVVHMAKHRRAEDELNRPST